MTLPLGDDATPRIQPVLRPGQSPRYCRLMSEHADVIKAGTALGRPTSALNKEAWDWAKEAHRLRSFAGASTKDSFGGDHIAFNAFGQIGAELLARLYGTTADWELYVGKSDPGWDVVLGQQRIDVKTRQGLLTLKDHEGRNLAADYFALVERTHQGDYIFCGVIRPIEYMRVRFPIFINEPMWACASSMLTPAYQFRPFEE